MNKRWLDRYDILDDDHAYGLNAKAAIHEFINKMPRHDAEDQAHKDYKKEQLEDSAAHHHKGMNTSFAAGDDESGKKHALLYTLAMKALGHEAHAKAPPEIENKIKNNPHKLYKFKNHPADSFLLLQDNKEGKEE